MTNGEKILTGIVIIAAIITIIIVITNNNAKNKIENQKNEIDNIEDYLNGMLVQWWHKAYGSNQPISDLT